MLTRAITNNREYQTARAEVRGLREAAEQQYDATAGMEPHLREAMRSATEGRILELEERIAWYESLQRSGGAEVDVSLAEVPALLIQARVAAGLTQKDLARRLGVTEQQVQKDEKAGYTHASLERLIRVSNALGLTVRVAAILPSPVARAATDAGPAGNGSADARPPQAHFTVPAESDTATSRIEEMRR